MIPSPTILYVDPEPSNINRFRKSFPEYDVKTSLSAQEALEIIKNEGEKIPVLIVGQSFPGLMGTEICERAAKLHPKMFRIIMTAYTAPHYLLEAINRGHVNDYVEKPWDREILKPILNKAIQDYQQHTTKIRDLERRAAKSDALEKQIREIYDSEAIIGEGTSLKPNMEVIKKAAPTDSTILILGETGTGKELLARATHDRSLRKEGPFVPVHCASLAKTLMESELFGHEKGAFTGADRMHVGFFESAHGGTIFLDEIGELTEEIQVKLLRVLQQKQIHRVGSNRPITIDVRLVAATHRNLEAMVKEGKFRQDLFYRLNVIVIKVPPLRERKEDISILAKYFLEKHSKKLGKHLKLPQETLAYLSRYDWPGNVRELENIMERAIILSEGLNIEPVDLNLNIEEILKVEKIDIDQALASESVRSKMREDEMKTLRDLLVKNKGNLAEAARAMGIPRTTLFYRLRKYRLV